MKILTAMKLPSLCIFVLGLFEEFPLFDARNCNEIDALYNAWRVCDIQIDAANNRIIEPVMRLLEDRDITQSDIQASAALGCGFFEEVKTCVRNKMTDCSNYASEISSLLTTEEGQICTSDGRPSTIFQSSIDEFSGLTLNERCDRATRPLGTDCGDENVHDLMQQPVKDLKKILQEKLDGEVQCRINSIDGVDVSNCGEVIDVKRSVVVIMYVRTGATLFLPFVYDRYLNGTHDAGIQSFLGTLLGM